MAWPELQGKLASDPEKEKISHHIQLVEQLKSQRDSGQFCDVHLVVDDHEYDAHRCVLAACSAYFDSMFRGGFVEVGSKYVQLQCTSANGMQCILDFMYVGTAHLTMDNVYDVIKGADHFLMTDLKNFCGNFLEKHLTASNCFDVRELARLYDMKKMEDAANSTIEARMSVILKDPNQNLIQCSFQEILSIVSNVNLQVREDELLEFIINWTKHDLGDRQSEFVKLFNQIRLDSIDRENLALFNSTEELVYQNNDCANLVKEVLNCGTDSRGRLQPRLGRLVDVYILCGGSNWSITLPKSFYGYVVEENRWVELVSPRIDLWPTQVTEMDNKLYAIGSCDPFTARGYNPIQTSAVCYDPLINEWQPIANPIYLHYTGASVVCNKRLYCLGGKFSPSSMEMYDPNTDTWVERAPLINTYHKKYVAIDVNDRYIYIIEERETQFANCQGIDFYDTHTDQWETSFPSSAVWELEDDDSCQIWPPIAQRLPEAVEITRLGKYKIVISTDSREISFAETYYPSVQDGSGQVACPAVVRTRKGDVFACSGCRSSKLQSASVDLRPNDGSSHVYHYADRSWEKFTPNPSPTMIPGQLCAMIQIPHCFIA
ncbi:kelch-like protein 11 [Ptychodera flava]|uniref:kelch-like protein 11 n=1 Tax=Ptychodera flava TaxID=63121 RepID=UPI00396A48B2